MSIMDGNEVVLAQEYIKLTDGQPGSNRTMSKGIIQYGGPPYWHDNLWEVPANTVVEIRVQPRYMRPDEIRVI